MATGSSRSTRPYSGVSQARHEAAVSKYRDAFSADVVWLMRSRVLRGFTSVWRWVYRLTGGRFGLAPGWVDLDAVAISFAVDRVLIPFGASTGDLAIESEFVVVPIEEGAMQLDRSTIADQVRRALRDANIYRRVILRFTDGDEVLTGSRDVAQ